MSRAPEKHLPELHDAVVTDGQKRRIVEILKPTRVVARASFGDRAPVTIELTTWDRDAAVWRGLEVTR